MALQAALWTGYSQMLTERLSQYCEGWDAGLEVSPTTGYKWDKSKGEGKVDWGAVVKAGVLGGAILAPTGIIIAQVQAKVLQQLKLSGRQLQAFNLLFSTVFATPITVAVFCFF